MQKKDTEGISGNVQDIHKQRDQHSCPGVPYGAKGSGAGVIEGKEREGKGGNQHIDGSIAHHTGFYLTENHSQNVVSSDEKNQGDQGSCCQGKEKELSGGPSGFFLFSGTDILRAYNGSTGGDGKQNLDNQKVDGVDQGDPRYGSLANGGHHQNIYHSDKYGQQLFYQQGPDQCE